MKPLSRDRTAHPLLRLWPFLRPHTFALVLSSVWMILGALLALARPLVMRGGLSALEGHGNLLPALGWLGAVLVGEQLAAFPQQVWIQRIGARAIETLRAFVFHFLHTRSLGLFDRTPIARLILRATHDTEALLELFTQNIFNVLGDGIRLIGILCVMAFIDFRLTLLMVLGTGPLALGVLWLQRRMRSAFRAQRERLSQLSAFLTDQVSGVMTVQAFAREERAREELGQLDNRYLSEVRKTLVLGSGLDAALELVFGMSLALVLGYSALRALGAPVSFGNVLAFVACLDMFFTPIRQAASRNSTYQSALASAERILELLDGGDEDAPVSSAAPPSPESPVPAPPAFEISRVTFSYDGAEHTLRDVTLSVREGEVIACVGPSGSGKSTLAALLLRLYEPQSGQVRVRGQDVRLQSRESLRRLFAVVSQEVWLVSGTVAENVALGEAAPDPTRVRSALEQIGALELFEGMPGGLNAKVLERGENLSSGERQLLAFARALYRDPPFLILDEPTSTLDPQTEARLLRAVEGAIRGRTVLIIAHRLTTIRSAHRIMVIHQGCLFEEGDHASLLARGGLYAQLYRLQHPSLPKSAEGVG